MTNSWTDIANADVILAMGGNPAENHPVGFRFVMEAKRRRNAKLVAVDVRFQRTAAVADYFVQIRPGTDIAFLAGVINYALQHGRYHEEYLRIHTNAPFIVAETYDFDPETGLFSGWDPEKREYDRSGWVYELDEQGYAKVDPTLRHPRCVFQLMKRHFARYTPEVVSRICGCSEEAFLKAAEIITSTYTPDRVGTILYALGWTHHSYSVQLIHTAAMLQLILGNIGRPGGGINALRGHANVQGNTDMAVQWHNRPGYLAMPRGKWQSLREYIEARTPKPLRPNSVNFWKYTDRFFISQQVAFYGYNATPENEFGYHWFPKIPMKADGSEEKWSVVFMIDAMYRGEMVGLFSFGQNPVAHGPNTRKIIKGLANLKWLVVVDNFEHETASFWKPEVLALVGLRPEDVRTEVFLLPASNFAERDGSFTNSSRWIQWKYKAIDPPGEAKDDPEIIARLFLKVRELYEKEGGRFPEPILNLWWWYADPERPSAEELLREINGFALRDVRDGEGRVILRRGEQVRGFTQLQADGTTCSGNWLYVGVYTDQNNAKRRDSYDPTGLGFFHGWAFNWPANRRILYNRASADAQGRPWDPQRPGIRWNGREWVGDVPDYGRTSPPEEEIGAFIMLPEGVARLFVPLGFGSYQDGPFPEHYEPLESPVPNPLHPKSPTRGKNPVAIVFRDADVDILTEDLRKYPYVVTTYRLTEHHHYWTKNNAMNSELQSTFFIEIPEELAAEKGIRSGDWLRLVTPRGHVEGPAMVTKRIRPLRVNGTKVYVVGVPIHWGFLGASKKKQWGGMANLLTPSVVDPNCHTPEYKAFLCNIEKIARKT